MKLEWEEGGPENNPTGLGKLDAVSLLLGWDNAGHCGGRKTMWWTEDNVVDGRQCGVEVSEM
jgi:hypothetical protein